MKKLTALLLCLIVAAGVFSGCAENPKAALDNATKKTNELGSYESNISMNLKMEYSGISMDIPVELNAKYEKKDDKILMNTTANLELMGMKVETDTYFADGFMYTDAMGQKVKTAVPVEDILKNTPVSSDFSGDAVTEVKAEKVEGGTKYTPTVDEAKMNEFVQSVLSQAQSSMGGAGNFGELEGTEFSNLETYIIVNKDGYVAEQWIKMDVVMKAAVPDATGNTTETEIKMSIDMTSSFINPGQAVTVTVPENLDEYQFIGDIS